MTRDSHGSEAMRFPVLDAAVGQRLDVWLHAQLPAYSRSRLQALIRAGCVRVNGDVVRAHATTHAGAVVTVAVPAAAPVALAAEDIPLDILYEDAEVVVVDKPAGLVVHPAAGHPGGTLVNALLHHCQDLVGVGGERRPGIVHRLDKDTSGVVVVAKSDCALQSLVDQFKTRQVHKEYAALVRGVPDPPQRRIETLVGRSRHDRKKMSAQPPRGRRAVTVYEVTEVFGDEAALVAVMIETGRTHQIRVHMTYVGHPVLGDAVYGRGRPVADLGVPERQMLHARRLSFVHPVTKERLTFEAPLPADMVGWINRLRGGKHG